jgi:hypothetical protein
MALHELLKKISELGFQANEIAVPLKLYFEGNSVVGSIVPNAYPDPVDPRDLYKDLSALMETGTVQDILVRICDVEGEDWPYTDSIYILTSMSAAELSERLSKYAPDEIQEGWMYGEPRGVPELKDNYKAFTVWWD